MVASAVFILDLKGKVLISRNYRGDIPMTASDQFVTLLQEAEDEQQTTPIVHHGGYHYLYVRHMNVYCKSCDDSLDS